jgi:hypothetical protein
MEHQIKCRIDQEDGEREAINSCNVRYLHSRLENETWDGVAVDLGTVGDRSPKVRDLGGSPVALAAGYALDVAIEQKDWTTGEQILEAVRKANLDGCKGQFFEARLAHRQRG